MTFGNRPGIPDSSFRSDHADATQAVVAGLGRVIVRPGEAPDLRGVTNARLLLLEGDHGGMLVKSQNAIIKGVPGAYFSRKVVVEADCSFSDVDFVWFGGSNTDDTLVTVAAGFTARFTNCRFFRATYIDPTCVDIAATGKAHFVDCLFGPAVSVAGFTVNNAGAAVNAYIVGCSRKTGQPHNNVVVFGETT